MTQTDQTASEVGHADRQDETETLLRGEIRSLQKRLDERFREIAALTGLIESAQGRGEDAAGQFSTRIAELEEQIRQMQARHALELQLQRIGMTVWRDGVGDQVPALEKQVETLEASDLFDAAWYLETYPDLAEAGVSPADHYLRAGAFEGRDPGPSFGSMNYYLANPDVVPAGWPALVHYEMFGRAEGRPLAPGAAAQPVTETVAEPLAGSGG